MSKPIPNDIKNDFQHFILDMPDRLHFAAHSHHPWPDVSLEAQTQCWQDAAAMIDGKWDKIFSELIPELQDQIAGILNLPNHGKSIAFAPNTHEFVNRLLSSLPINGASKILTTDSEFHSFNRQVTRLEQEELLSIERIPTLDFETFEKRFIQAASNDDFDLIFLSQTFFNSGFRISDLPHFIKKLSQSIGNNTPIIIDGYHAFMAVPTDLSTIADRIFYIAGGYKYAMSGEGACFMHCPNNFIPQPRNTGWFATMDQLTSKQDKVTYSKDGFRFMGSTFDPSGLYRMNAVFKWLKKKDLKVEDIHTHVTSLMAYFVAFCHGKANLPFTLDTLMIAPSAGNEIYHGHFLTFETDKAADIYQKLKFMNVITDHRDTRLRFGFGLYHDKSDVETLVQQLIKI